VLVGISNHVKDTDDAVGVSLHTPLKPKGTDEGEDEVPVVVGKGKTPFPGTDIEDDWDKYPLLVELELLGIITVEFELYGVPVAETEPLELEVCDPIAVELELTVPAGGAIGVERIYSRFHIQAKVVGLGFGQ
jgi:hypothetical protein